MAEVLLKKSHVQFHRIGGGPLLVPDPEREWEAGGVFAPAVIHTGEVYRMLYRAFGSDGKSRLGYGESLDGLEWKTMERPLLSPSNTTERMGIEDPRIVQIDDTFYITYTAVRGKPNHFRTQVRIMRTKDFVSFTRTMTSFRGNWRRNDKDAVLFPEKFNGMYHILHRIEPNIDHSISKDLKHWQTSQIVFGPSHHAWESLRIGAGSTPILTELGWLLFYHGVSQQHVYSMSAAILDRDNPAKTLYRLPFPILTPKMPYELDGVVPNVVFGTSALAIDGKFRMYYGAGDRVIAAAEIDQGDLLKEIVNHPVNYS